MSTPLECCFTASVPVGVAGGRWEGCTPRNRVACWHEYPLGLVSPARTCLSPALPCSCCAQHERCLPLPHAGEPPRRGQMPPLRVPEHCPAEVAALYQRCTSEDIDERPTASELLETLRRLPPARRPQHTGQDAPLTPPQLSLHDTVQGPAGRSGGAGGRSGRETTASQRPAAQVQQASGSAAPSQAGNSDLPSPFSAAAAAKPASRHGHASRRSRIRIPAPLRSFSWHPPDSDWASPFATARATLAEQPGVAATTAGAVEARSGSGAPRRASSWHTPAGSPTSPIATPAGIAGQPAVGLAAQPSS